MGLLRTLKRQAARSVTPAQRGRAEEVTRAFMEGKMSESEARVRLIDAAGGIKSDWAKRAIDKKMANLVELKRLFTRAQEMERTGEAKTNKAEYEALLKRAQALKG